MKILGIHTNIHESGCALVVDGQIRHAVSQERPDRNKMSGVLPVEAIGAMLGAEGISPSEIDILAISDDIGIRGYRRSWRLMKDLLLRETLPAARRHYGMSLLKLLRFYFRHRFGGSFKFCRYRQTRIDRVKAYLACSGFAGRVESYEHGYSHAASAYYPSGFDDCLIFVMEDSSFINASSVYLGRSGRIEKILDIPFPHSAGKFYSTITQLLGFRPNCHEGKITGLAALGNSNNARRLAKSLFYLRDDADDFYVDPLIHLWWWDSRGKSQIKALPSELRPYASEDLAAAWQMALEEGIVALIRRYLRRYPDIRHVALAGGVHSNVKLNQKINELDEVEEIYVHPGMGDCGQPVGAALASWAKNFVKGSAKNSGSPKTFRHSDVYLGPSLSTDEIGHLVAEYELVFDETDIENLPDRVAGLLEAKKVVGVCRGRMEYGPRALGNRSILYSPADPSVNDWLNKQLKRTEFMPFAPVTLMEEADKCYINARKSAYTTGFMTLCYACTEFMKTTQSAAVHTDGSARPQYISRRQNPFYYDVVARFRDRTGLPSLINTSFNMHEEPIVCNATEALRAFVAGNLDALVLENKLLLRKANPTLRKKMLL